MDKSRQVLGLLEIRLYTIKALKGLTKNNINFINWYENTSNLLKNIFGNGFFVKEFNSIQFSSTKNIYNDLTLVPEKIRISYLEGLDQAKDILKEAIEKYSQFCSIEKSTFGLENKFSFEEIKSIIQTLDLKEMEKLEKKVEKALTDLDNFQSNDYEKEVIYDNVVKVLNEIQPKVSRVLVFNSLKEILDSSSGRV